MAIAPNDLSTSSFITKDPGVYKSTLIGTAVGTPAIASSPVFFKSIFFPNRVASGSVVIYDSPGTSGTVIGTIVLGTQTNTDPPPPYEFNMRTNNGLSVVNSGNLGAIVFTGI
jgi:hypothetical protein